MSEYPLISCIMPTTGTRKRFVAQAIKYFQWQDYSNKELIIINEDEFEMVGEVVSAQENISFTSIYSERSLSIGMKRNIACSLAQGEIICTWDDDDYYGPQRLTKQVEPILHATADATGLTMGMVFNISAWQAWTCSSVLHKELWVHDMVSGTLMFRKSLWNTLVMYPDKSIGEDADFIALLSQHGVRLAQVQSNGAFIYIRHTEQNIWPLSPYHTHPPVQGWQQVPIEQYLSAEEQAFYRQFQAVQA